MADTQAAARQFEQKVQSSPSVLVQGASEQTLRQAQVEKVANVSTQTQQQQQQVPTTGGGGAGGRGGAPAAGGGGGGGGVAGGAAGAGAGGSATTFTARLENLSEQTFQQTSVQCAILPPPQQPRTAAAISGRLSAASRAGSEGFRLRE